MGRKVNVGCGEYILKDFENVDGFAVNGNPAVIVVDALQYDYRDTDLVYAGHFMEHLTIDDGRAFLRRVAAQAPAATVVVTVPVVDRCDAEAFWWFQMIVFGGRRWKGDEHKSVWRVKDIHREMAEAGYKVLEEWPDCPYLADRVGWQICIKGRRQ